MVHLVPMDETEFQAYLRRSLPDYAQDHVQAGNWPVEEALTLAEQQVHGLLPQGLATQDHYLFTLEDPDLGAKVGMLWFMVRWRGGQPEAFVCDIHIEEAFRRRGYATQAFQALEEKARDLGLVGLSLHVFGHNDAARALYEKLGFRAVDLLLAKELGEP